MSTITDRRGYIGSSDIAVILGISPFKSPLELYLEKRGEIEAWEGNEATDFGNIFEESVIKAFERKSGMTVDPARQIKYIHHDYDFIGCTVDASVMNGRVFYPEAIVEAKTSMTWNEGEWDDGPPLYIQAQVQHQMMVSGIDKTYIPVFFSNRHFEIYEVNRDEEMIEDLLRIELEFWDRIQSGNPPAVTSRDVSVLGKWFSKSSENSVDLSPEHLEIVKRCAELGPIIKSYEDERDYLKAQLMKELGESDTGLWNGKKIVTWKSQTRTDVDRKSLKEQEPEVYERYKTESAFRVMRFYWKDEG